MIILKENDEEFMMNAYVNETGDSRRIERSVEGWKNRIGIELARRECMDRERWRLFCHDYLLGRRSQREQNIKRLWNVIE